MIWQVLFGVWGFIVFGGTFMYYCFMLDVIKHKYDKPERYKRWRG